MESVLTSWRASSPARKAILDFVSRVCSEGSDEFVHPSERIAVFDNDGTLWSEQPFYFQGLFLLERIHALAEQHPEWRNTQPFQAALEGDRETLKAFGMKGLMELALGALTGTTTDEYNQLAHEWLNTRTHPQTGQLFTDMVFQPMLELLEYLRANGFKTFIVSGGGIEFVRAFSERVYGIPPEQVIGSSIKTQYQVHNGNPALVRLPELNFIDDHEGKPVGINQHIGRRPIAAFGNSDGDLQMLEWTTSGPGPRFGMIVHHDDSEREFAYDRESAAGRLNRGFTEAQQHGWTLVSMKDDWETVFADTTNRKAQENSLTQ
jgi:phosphoglycolate phosphatase-like HAD superfamily hydrolase